MMMPFVYLLDRLLMLYEWVLIATIVLHWLIYFKIVNPYQKFVHKLNAVLNRLTEPVLRIIRKVIPPISGVDLSPIFLFLAIFFLRDMLYVTAMR